ncbi:hypothetical protein NUACC26_070350 [Scytonema sp. NUACC26]
MVAESQVENLGKTFSKHQKLVYLDYFLVVRASSPVHSYLSFREENQIARG